MNRTELTQKVAEKTGMTRKDVDCVVAQLLDDIMEAVAAGEKVQILGFGTFETRTRGARMGRNPRSGEALEIAESKAPCFHAGKSFKDRIR